MQRSLRSMVVVVATTIGLLVGAIAPAGALSDTPTLAEEVRAIKTRKLPRVVRSSVPTDVRPDVPVDVRPDTPTDVRPDVRPDRPLDVIKLECDRLEDADGKAAGCRWSESDQARGYQLWVIVNRGERELVGTYGAETLGAKDRLPEDTLLARYAVVALGTDGEIVGRSRLATVRFRSEPPVVDALKIECEKLADGDGKAAGCEWSGTEQARAYQLWRLVNRGHRELVGTFDNNTFEAKDRLPNETHLVRYAVIALGQDGEIVGRSRVVSLEYRPVRPVEPTPTHVEPVDAKPAPVAVRRG